MNLTWGARVRMECNGEGSLCPAGIERMDGYLVKMEADFEVTKGEMRKREIPEKYHFEIPATFPDPELTPENYLTNVFSISESNFP